MTEAAGGPSPARPRVVLVGLGGTIAITGSDEAGVAEGRGVTDLLASLPGIRVVSGATAPDELLGNEAGAGPLDAGALPAATHMADAVHRAVSRAEPPAPRPPAVAPGPAGGAGPGGGPAPQGGSAGAWRGDKPAGGGGPGGGPASPDGRAGAWRGDEPAGGGGPGGGPASQDGRDATVGTAVARGGDEPAGGGGPGGGPASPDGRAATVGTAVAGSARGSGELSADAVPAAGAGRRDIEVEPVDLRMVPGSALSLDDLAATATFVRQRLAGGATGAVVTQGTDTIEETAYFLDLLHDGAEPVVVTGAMRGPRLVGDDGPANLLGAIRTAASPAARGLGCLVVFADEIHAASRVRKTHASSIATFASPNGGPLGYLVEGVPRILNRPTRRTVVPPPRRPWPRVGLVTATLGAPFEVGADGLDGLVVAGFGVGHVPPAWMPALAALAGRIPVVLASRTGAGAVHAAMYDYAGSERDLQDRGLIPARLLDPYKARILLLLALASGLDRATIRAVLLDATP